MSATPIPTNIVYMEGAEAISFFRVLLSIVNSKKPGGHSKRFDQERPGKKKTNSRGGTSDGYGDGGKVLYNGKAWFGTNYIGLGPDIDPHELIAKQNLMPLDMVDQAAFEHDYSYYLLKASGIQGALLNLRVLEAYKKLARDALNVMKQYKKGN